MQNALLLQLLRDLPDMAGRVGEAGGAHTPLPVHRPVDEVDSPAGELVADGIDVIHEDRELQARSGIATGNPAGSIKLCAAVVTSRLIMAVLNLKTAELASS